MSGYRVTEVEALGYGTDGQVTIRLATNDWAVSVGPEAIPPGAVTALVEWLRDSRLVGLCLDAAPTPTIGASCNLLDGHRGAHTDGEGCHWKPEDV